jgi:tetratricopeptide (TPR) repeat protein
MMRARGTLMALVIAACATSVGAAEALTPAEWRRAHVTEDLERFARWVELNAGSPVPSDAQIGLDPVELPLFVRGVPKDARQQLALGIVLLQDGHPHEALAPLTLASRLLQDRHPREAAAAFRTAGRDPAIAERADALLGCTLVMLGRYREAIEHLDAAPLDASCLWEHPQYRALPMATWRAAARCALGDGVGARRVIASALGPRAALVDPSMPSEMDERDAAATMACIVGDAFELDDDPASAETLWRRGHCVDRLDELAAATDPFALYARRRESPGWELVDTASAVAATALGDVVDAEGELESAAYLCQSPDAWTPNCLRLRRVRQRLAPFLSEQRRAAVAREAPPARPYVVRSVPRRLATPIDPRIEGRAVEELLVPPALAEWNVVRVDRDGSEVVALSFGYRSERSWSYPFVTYRLHVSHDGGSGFELPLFLGVGAPLTARPLSRVPLLSGDTVQVEARALRPGRAPVLLTFELAELTRDSDGDGLTDVLESRWLLDAHRADTDGDTVSDGMDLSPRLPPTSRRPELNPFIDWLLSDAAVAALETAPESAEDARPSGRSGLSSAPTPRRSAEPPLLQEQVFLVMLQPVPLFRHLLWPPDAPPLPPSTGPRVLALSDAEVEAETKPEPYPEMNRDQGLTRLKIVFDRDGSRALVSLDFGSEGRDFVATRGASGWVLRCISNWVS